MNSAPHTCLPPLPASSRINSASHSVVSLSAQLTAEGWARASLCGSGCCMHAQKLWAFHTLHSTIGSLAFFPKGRGVADPLARQREGSQ